jgi:hypothetical protein
LSSANGSAPSPFSPATEPARLPDPIAAAGEKGEGADPFAELKAYAKENLRKIEQSLVVVLCDFGGRLPIDDLRLKDGIDWDNATTGFKDAQTRLNKKLKRLKWRLIRESNMACLIQIKPKK